MPRPVPLPTVGKLINKGTSIKFDFERPLKEPKKLDDREWRKIAQALGRETLCSEAKERIEHIVFVYNLAEQLPQPTPGTVIAFLKDASRDIEKGNRKHSPQRLAKAQKQVEKLLHPRSPLDAETQELLASPARVLLSAGRPNFQEAASRLVAIIDNRIKQLRQHRRVAPPTQSLRYMCALLRFAFRMFKAADIPPQQARLRAFAFAVFNAFELMVADSFADHPGRLDDHLLSALPPPEWFRESS